MVFTRSDAKTAAASKRQTRNSASANGIELTAGIDSSTPATSAIKANKKVTASTVNEGNKQVPAVGRPSRPLTARKPARITAREMPVINTHDAQDEMVAASPADSVERSNTSNTITTANTANSAYKKAPDVTSSSLPLHSRKSARLEARKMSAWGAEHEAIATYPSGESNAQHVGAASPDVDAPEPNKEEDAVQDLTNRLERSSTALNDPDDHGIEHEPAIASPSGETQEQHDDASSSSSDDSEPEEMVAADEDLLGLPVPIHTVDAKFFQPYRTVRPIPPPLPWAALSVELRMRILRMTEARHSGVVSGVEDFAFHLPPDSPAWVGPLVADEEAILRARAWYQHHVKWGLGYRTSSAAVADRRA